MLSDGNKEEEEGDGEVIILCPTDVERVVSGDGTGRDGTGRDGTEHNGMGRDMTGRDGKGSKMSLDGNKEKEVEDGDVIILCSMDVERVVPGGEVERKFT
ncbi:hypothetical protein DVH24_025510 [Malus domestica]|uniref:Uncharacterized protein n=1 Tax=Malus domestica TaxID=3750 RepID=A0A498HM39_MALDO|nr:hypothetical protein DVH24_025510 [Malus domestica]